ncbi:MAG: hypothetical protein WBA66_01500 [Xanthobacteraceae bacterium]
MVEKDVPHPSKAARTILTAFGQVKIGRGQRNRWNRLIPFGKINRTGNVAALRQELRQIVAAAHDGARGNRPVARSQAG